MTRHARSFGKPSLRTNVRRAAQKPERPTSHLRLNRRPLRSGRETRCRLIRRQTRATPPAPACGRTRRPLARPATVRRARLARRRLTVESFHLRATRHAPAFGNPSLRTNVRRAARNPARPTSHLRLDRFPLRLEKATPHGFRASALQPFPRSPGSVKKPASSRFRPGTAKRCFHFPARRSSLGVSGDSRAQSKSKGGGRRTGKWT